LKAHFLTPHIETRRILGSNKRILLADFSFYSAKRQKTYTAKKGFTFNGPSFPLVWGGDGEGSSCIHDMTYANPDEFPRDEGDDVLLECLEVEGMNAVRRRGWWALVRAVGWNYYGKGRDETDDAPTDHSPG
jgi:hypothetical protein